MVQQAVDRSSDVLVDGLEIAFFAAAVTHAAHIEAHRDVACRSDRAGEQHELSVASDAVLGPAHDDEDRRSVAVPIRLRDDSGQRLAFAFEQQRGLVNGHGKG